MKNKKERLIWKHAYFPTPFLIICFIHLSLIFSSFMDLHIFVFIVNLYWEHMGTSLDPWNDDTTSHLET